MSIDRCNASQPEPTHDATPDWCPRDRYLAILAHDLQTPLTAVILTAGGELRHAKDAHQRAAALRVLGCAERMKQMTADLLDLARTRSQGTLPVKPRTVSLADLAAEAVGEVETSRPGSRIRVEAQGDVRGEWDPPRIAQVLVNLLTNAVQHGADGAPVEVRLVRCPDSIWIDVVNQGEPIPESEMPRLFEPFARGRSARSGRGSVGLGLFIVAEIVAAHGGDVRAFNSPAAGTVTFRVRVPVRSAPRE
jgi:signal transduction histidine kinase